MRTLLHGAAQTEPHNAAEPLGPRLLAMGVIFAAGLLGVALPLCSRAITRAPEAPLARCIRAFGGGVCLALALIHIIPEGIEQLEGLGLGYPLGGVPVVVGLLSIVCLDYAAALVAARREQQRLAVLRAKQASVDVDDNAAVAAAGTVAAAAAAASDAELGCVTLHQQQRQQPHEQPCAAGDHQHQHQHHEHLAHCHTEQLRRCVAAYSLEASCVFHSVVIGVGIGAITDAPRLLATLTAAMAFHQLVEGAALGAVLAAVVAPPLGRWRRAAMALVFAGCMPFGIAIGIGAAGAYSDDSLVALAVQGTLNGVSGGMLLAVALASLIGEELSRADLVARPRLAAALMLCIALGVGAMAVIGIWG